MDENRNQQPLEETKEVYQGLGCALYALANIDGQLQSEETEILRLTLMREPNGLQVLEAFDIQDQYQVSVEEAYAYAFRRFAASRNVLSEEMKKHFTQIMEKVAYAYDGVSRKENEILRRFRRDINRL